MLRSGESQKGTTHEYQPRVLLPLGTGTRTRTGTRVREPDAQESFERTDPIRSLLHDQLPADVRRVQLAGNGKDPGFARHKLNRLRSAGQAGDGKPPVVRLTLRESQILGCFRRGLADKEIAVEFGIGVQTVKNENTRLFQKLGVHNRYDASRVATGNLREKQPGSA